MRLHVAVSLPIVVLHVFESHWACLVVRGRAFSSVFALYVATSARSLAVLVCLCVGGWQAHPYARVRVQQLAPSQAYVRFDPV